MSRRKEEGRKREREKIFFNDFHFLPMAWKKSPRPISKKRKRWKIVIEHHSTWFVFFNFFSSSTSSSEEPRFVWTGICFERFISLRSNQIKSTGMKRTTSVRKNISRFFRGYVFGREEGIEGNKCWRITPFTVVGVTLSRTRSPGFKVHKMLSA